jgi:hypothetical protein
MASKTIVKMPSGILALSPYTVKISDAKSYKRSRHMASFEGSTDPDPSSEALSRQERREGIAEGVHHAQGMRRMDRVGDYVEASSSDCSSSCSVQTQCLAV